MKKSFLKNLCLFLLFLSISFNITYWAIAKYDVTTDFSSVSDAYHYINMSKSDYEKVPRRFFNRFLVPSLVSKMNQHLKIDSILKRLNYENADHKAIQFNFGVLNIIFLASTAFIFYYYCINLGFAELESLLCSFLFLTSFYVITYFTVPLVDAAGCFFVMASVYSFMRRRYLWLMIAFLCGMVSKEITVIVLFVILFDERKVLSKTFLYCVPGIIVFFIISNIGKGLPGDSDIMSILTPSKLMANFMKAINDYGLHRLIEFTEVYMFLWVLLIYGLFKSMKPVFLKKQLWLLLVTPTIQFMMGDAMAGRITFYSFFVVIPISFLALKDLVLIKEN